MILLWLTIAVVLAGLIARYNQSNKLFWILFTSFVVGISGGAMYQKYKAGTSRSKECCVQVQPTQASSVSVTNVTTDTCMIPTSTLVPEPVSQDYVPESYTTFPTVSKCCVDTSTPPPDSKPLQVCIDSLTHPN